MVNFLNSFCSSNQAWLKVFSNKILLNNQAYLNVMSNNCKIVENRFAKKPGILENPGI